MPSISIVRMCPEFRRRRGAVAVQVAIGLTAIMGFAALSVDVGMLYAAKADLQNISDSAALAAASQLGNFLAAEEQDKSVIELATEAAIEYAQSNEVLGADFVLTEDDIEFGWSTWDVYNEKYEFEAAPEGVTANINGVRITARRTNSHTNGAIDMAFAGVLGFNNAELEISATAILVPRDILVVGDLSGSYNDDSELRHYDDNDPDGINLYEVWQTLPSSSANGVLLQAWLDANPGMTVADAPDIYFQIANGFFAELGSSAPGEVEVFGQTTINSSYDPTTDSGLVYLPWKTSWTSGTLGATHYNAMRNYLSGLGYNDQEVRYIMGDGSGSDSSVRSGDDDGQSFSSSEYSDKDRYEYRVAVAMGLVYWDSGVAGGLCDTMGWTNGSGGWGISASELVAKEDYPFPSGNWYEYVQYVRDANGGNKAYDELSDIKYRFGPKTFVNFLLEDKAYNSETDVIHHAYANPLNLTKNALEVLMDDLLEVDSGDHVGLVTYGSYAKLEYPIPCDSSDVDCVAPVDLETNVTDVENMYRARQASHYASSTNIGEGLQFAMNCLNQEFDGYDPGWNSSPDFSGCQPRPEAQKVIVLLTDGIANRDSEGGNTRPGGGSYSTSNAETYAQQVSADAWDHYHMRVYGIGVGSGADMDLMDDVAENGQTEEGYWANGTFEEIQDELEEIFQKIGGRRPIQLIN